MSEDGATILWNLFFDSIVMALRKLQITHKLTIKWTLSDDGSIQKGIATYMRQQLPILELFILINYSESFRFFEVMLLRSQEYLSKETMEKWGDCSGGI